MPPRDAISSRQAGSGRGSRPAEEGGRPGRSIRHAGVEQRTARAFHVSRDGAHAAAAAGGVGKYLLLRGASLSWRWARHGFVQGFVVRAHPGDGQCQLRAAERRSERASGGDDDRDGAHGG
jgi:hypothetical protein